MGTSSEERLRAVLARLASREQEEVLDFAEFLAQRQAGTTPSVERLSEEEHARIVAALDAVAVLSQDTGPAVSNRDHDAWLYGER
jgi:hypothetical protein